MQVDSYSDPSTNNLLNELSQLGVLPAVDPWQVATVYDFIDESKCTFAIVSTSQVEAPNSRDLRPSINDYGNRLVRVLRWKVDCTREDRFVLPQIGGEAMNAHARRTSTLRALSGGVLGSSLCWTASGGP